MTRVAEQLIIRHQTKRPNPVAKYTPEVKYTSGAIDSPEARLTPEARLIAELAERQVYVGTRSANRLFAVREVAIDFAHPPAEAALRSVLAEPMPILSWHLGVTEAKHLQELPPEFALFFRALLDDERHRHLLLLSLDHTIGYSEQMLTGIQACREAFLPQVTLLETAHPSWKSRTIEARMKREKIEHVLIDAPPLFGIIKDVRYTMPTRSYLRILGRDARTWFDPTPARHAYHYNGQELQEIVRRVEALRRESDEVFVLFVNHPSDIAEKNALALGALQHKRFEAEALEGA